jgi:hypothetical protein
MLLPLHVFKERGSVDGLRRQHLAHRAVHAWPPRMDSRHAHPPGGRLRVRAAVTGGRLRQAGAGRRGRGHRREPGGHHRG